MLKLLPLLFLLCLPSFARERVFGYCQQGGRTAAVSVNSGVFLGATVHPVMNSYPGCQITVYLAGTITPATIYSDNIGTPLANPFTTSSAGSGYWYFYVDNGRYDVKLSGGNIPTPFTLGDILVADPSQFSVGVTSLTGTANQICTSSTTGNVVVSICSNPTLPGTTTGTFVGPLTGDVTGNLSGNAATASAFNHTPTLCPAGQYTLGVNALGNAQGCSAVFGGDVTSNTSVSVDNEITLFSGITGKVIKRSTGNGVQIATSGVASYVAAASPIQFLRSKPNVSGTVYEFSGLPVYLAADYNFPAQLTGNIAIGANTVTLTPCPLGLAGTDASHYLWLSGGTGTAEAVAITGGTCTSGASTGTVAFTAVNTHSGAVTATSGSGGLREAILASGGNATIRLADNATALISGANGLVIDKQNLTIVASGWGSVVQARANQFFNSLLKVTNGDGLRLLNFTLDGNRANAGTNPTFGANIDCGVDNTGGCNHIVVQDMHIYQSAGAGIVIHDTNTDIKVENNFIERNGGVTNSSGNGVGMFVYWADPAQTPATNIKVNHNYFSENHNTITNAGPSSAFAAQGKDIFFTNNYVVNNYNDGGQVVISHYQSRHANIEGNIILRTATGLSEHTTGIETDSSYTAIVGNTISGHTTGVAIALEGNAAGPSGIGSESTTITANIVIGPGGCGSLNNAGGFTRATIISANRFAACDSWFVDTATSGTIFSDNNFQDATAPYITDNSVDGVYTSNNFPLAANLGYQGSLASANNLNMRCGQVAQVTGSTTINFISLPAETAGANGKGCQVTLIAASGATWSTGTGGTITTAVTPAAGTSVMLAYDGTNWNPGSVPASLPSVSKLQYVRGNPATATLEGANLPFLIAPDYNFAAQSPGGTISIGSNTKTLSPCPLGVAGSDVSHYLYLSGGTGTAEAVLIAGGSCTSGASSGTIVFTAANTHSGAYTITSASAGIKEAINMLPAQGGRILLPAANSPYSLKQVVVAGNGNSSATSTIDDISLVGDGSGNTDSEAFPITAGTMLQWDGPVGGTILDIEGPISGMHVSGIYFKCNGANRAATGLLSNHSFNSHFSDFQFNGCSNYAIKNYAYGNPVGIVTGANNNIWEQISIYSGGSATASGMQVGAGSFTVGDFVDVAQNFFRKLQVGAGASGTALDLRLTDSLTFDSFTTTSGSVGVKVDEVIGGGSFHFPQAITFNMPNMAGVTTVLDDSSWTGSLIGGWFWPYNNDNDTLDDPIGTQGWSAGVSNNGRFWGKFQTTPTVYTSVASSTAIASTNAETAFSKSFVLPAKSINLAGTRVRVTASGKYSTTGTPTMQLAMKVNGNQFALVPAVTTPNNASNLGWSFVGEFVVRVPGASGTVQNGRGTGGLNGVSLSEATWPNNFTLNTISTETVTVTATWSASSASNTIVMDELAGEIMASGNH